MHPNIRELRRRSTLTQQQLAKSAGVSQSLIAKLERGLLEPKYSIMQKIIAVLQSSLSQELTVEKLTNPHIVSCSPHWPLTKTLSHMQKNAVSQMPVIDDNKAIGTVSESTILKCLLDKKKNIRTVSDIMSQAPPQIPSSASINILKSLLSEYELVIVLENGKIKGIVSRIDLVTQLLNH